LIGVLCDFLEFARASFVVGMVNDGVGGEGDDGFVLRGEGEEGDSGEEREERQKKGKRRLTIFLPDTLRVEAKKVAMILNILYGGR